MKRSSFLIILIIGLSLLGRAWAQTPLASSPAVPTPYNSPMYHAGGVDTSAAFIYPGINPLVGRLQGTPSEVVPNNGSPTTTEIPSFLLGNYDPLLPPAGTSAAGVGVYFPNHFRDGSITSWSAPFTFLSIAPAISPTALGTYNATLLAADSTAVTLNHDVQSTPTAITYTQYPEVLTASYYGIDPTNLSTLDYPDPVIHGAGKLPTANPVNDPTIAANNAHVIRQLVYFGRSEYIVDTRAGSPTANTLIHVGAVYCVDGFTGEVVWRYQTATVAGRDPSVFSSPAVVRINVRLLNGTIANKLVVIFGDNNGFVYCLDAIGSGTTLATNGTSADSVVGSSNSDAVDTTNNQPVYNPTAPNAADGLPGHLGTTTAYWVYRPDVASPLTAAGAAVSAPIDATTLLPVPAAFGLASPNVYIEPHIATSPAIQSNSVVYLGNTDGVLYAFDGMGVANTTPHFNKSLSTAATLTPLLASNNTITDATATTNPIWWFWPGGAANSTVSMESTPAIAPFATSSTIPTVTVVTSGANPIPAGTPVTYTATVSDSTGSGVIPTGTVVISVSGDVSGPLPLVGGTATYSSAALVTPGANTVTATYTPTVGSGFTSSSSPTFSEFVEDGVATDQIVVVTSSENPSFTNPNPVFPSDTVTLTGTLYGGDGTPQGLAPISIDGGAPANSPVTISTLTVGTHSVTSASATSNYAGTFFQVVNTLSGPTVCIGTSQELGAGSNAGRLYGVDAFSGPLGNSGKVATPGAANYNLDQRPRWAFPNAYAQGTPGSVTLVGTTGVTQPIGIRPALGNITGSPVVFTNPDQTVVAKRTRIYFAADVGSETPYTATGTNAATSPAPRPAIDTTGRIWAVELNGQTAETVSTTPAVTNIWAYPLAFDPNDPTKDNVPEPSPPMGGFSNATPAMGLVQFPTTIQYFSGATLVSYTHADSVHTDVKGNTIPMLYIGTDGVDDFGFYALDVDGYDDTSRDIYRIESPTEVAFASSPSLVVNSTTAPTPPGPGNGGAVYATAGDSLFQFSATPVTNLNSSQAFPFISVDKTFTGFGPISSPSVAAGNVSDLTPTGALPVADNGFNATDWVYVGDSTTGFCRGITPLDTTDLAIIPPANFGGVQDAVPPLSIDAQYSLRTFLFDNTSTHSASTTSMQTANPLGGTVTPFEWGQFAYFRIANVVPPGPFDPASPDVTQLVTDPNDPTIVYGNGGQVTFKVGDASNPSVFAPLITIPAVKLTSLTGAPTDNGFIQRTANDFTPGEILSGALTNDGTATGYEWLAAYSYPVGSYRTRAGDTPGARRRVTEAHQTASAYKRVLNADGVTYTYTLSGKITLEAQTLQGVQSGNAQTGLTQTAPVTQPTFGILNPLALRGGGIPYSLGGSTAAYPVGTRTYGSSIPTEGLGPFRPVDPTLPKNTIDLQALTNGNTVYTTAPGSGYDITQDPTKASQNRETQAADYPQVPVLIATSLGLINDGSVGDNHDPTPNVLTPTGSGSAGIGLSVTTYGPYTLDVADRSPIGQHLSDVDTNGQTLFPKFTIAMQSAGAHWNDNTTYNGTALNGPGACINRLPWEELPTSVGLNTSQDYPDMKASAITHTLITSDGSEQEITGRKGTTVSPDVAVGTTDAARIVQLDPIKVQINVPQYQPANLQAWDATNQVGIMPSQLPLSTANPYFPEGYIEGGGSSQRVFIDLNHNGTWDSNEPERDVQIYSGVAVNMKTSIDGGTADLGTVPSAFGIQTSAYAPLGPFSPYTPNYQTKYLPITVYNNGNVNLLNVHFDQRNNTSFQTMLLNSDQLDPSSYIPAYDSFGVTGPRTGVFGSQSEQPYLLRSSLDTDLGLAYGRNPGIVGGGNDPVTNNSIPAQYPGLTFHKPVVGGVPTTLTVPDVPQSNVPGTTYGLAGNNGEPLVISSGLAVNNVQTLPDNSANTNYGHAATAPPYFSIAVPFGTPVGTYSQTLRMFEGNDANYSPFVGPTYNNARGGLDSLGTLSDIYQVSQQPLSDPGIVVKTTVTEDRLTDGLTFGALPQIDSQPASTTSTPDFAPAAYQDLSSGNLSLYWTSGRDASTTTLPYDIYGGKVNFSSPAYLAASGGQSWFSPISPTYSKGQIFDDSLANNPLTHSGLSIAQDVPIQSGGSYDSSTGYAFDVTVSSGVYQNKLYCYPVNLSAGTLGSPQLVTNDPAQVKYGIRGLYTTGAGFANNLWAFWTASTHGRTAIYYNSTAASSGIWLPANISLLTVPVGLTSVSDACPTVTPAPITVNGTTTLQNTLEIAFSGTAVDGNSDIYLCRYLPDSAKPAQLDLQTFSQVTEQLEANNGWYQARDVAWSRAAGVNVLVGGTAVLYALSAPNGPLYKSATFDKASGLLVFTGVTVPGVSGTTTLYMDLSTGRVRFVTPPPSASGPITATFSPQARRITDDARADTGVVTFLDPTYKSNEAAGLPRIPADRRWYFWRKAGTAEDTTSATLYYKSQRLTLILPYGPISVPSGSVPSINFTNNPAGTNIDVDAASGRLFFPINSGGVPLEGKEISGTYTDTNGNPRTFDDFIQWQDEERSNDSGGVPPTNSASGLAHVVDTKVPMNKNINDNNIAAFLDRNAYLQDTSSGTAATDAPHKVWLFWNSTRNGTADLYYETINPRFTASSP